MKVKHHKSIGWYIAYGNNLPTSLEHETYVEELKLNRKYAVSLTSKGDKQ